MTDTPKYPTISDASLIPFRALEAQLKQYPDILDRQDCPYPPHIKSLLRRLLGDQMAVVVDEGAMDDEDLVAETSKLYRQVQHTSQTMVVTDPKDQAQIFKTMASLLQQLTGLREKTLNLRSMSQFQKAIMTLLEGVLTPAQRSEFVELLGKYIEENR